LPAYKQLTKNYWQ